MTHTTTRYPYSLLVIFATVIGFMSFVLPTNANAQVNTTWWGPTGDDIAGTDLEALLEADLLANGGVTIANVWNEGWDRVQATADRICHAIFPGSVEAANYSLDLSDYSSPHMVARWGGSTWSTINQNGHMRGISCTSPASPSHTLYFDSETSGLTTKTITAGSSATIWYSDRPYNSDTGTGVAQPSWWPRDNTSPYTNPNLTIMAAGTTMTIAPYNQLRGPANAGAVDNCNSPSDSVTNNLNYPASQQYVNYVTTCSPDPYGGPDICNSSYQTVTDPSFYDEIKWGSFTVSPAAGVYTYTYGCDNASSASYVNRSVTLTVNAAVSPPVATLTPASVTINAGNSTTLNYTCTNSTSASINGTSKTPVGSGTHTVSPGVTTTYTLTCTGAGGTATDSTVVTVNPAPVATLTPASVTINSGNSTTLNYTCTNSTSASINGTSKTPVGSGTHTVSPVVTTTYTLTCTGTGGTATDSSVVTVAGLVNGVCSSPQTHYTCAPGGGSPGSQSNNINTWTWQCVGSGGGTTASCSENKPGVSTASTYSCSADGTQATLSWTPIGGADPPTNYLARLNNLANDSGSCTGGWLCSTPPDYADDYVQPPRTYTVIPGASNFFYVHGNWSPSTYIYGPTGGGLTFTCNAAPDLSAGAVTPTSAPASATTFSVTITNLIGGATAGFTNLLQRADTYAAGGGSPGTQVVTSGSSFNPATYGWTDGTLTIEVIGGGGGGRTGNVVGTDAGGGGAGGTYARVTGIKIPENVNGAVTISLGSGGTGGVAPTAGGSTWFGGSSCATSYACANGGAAASGSTGGVGATTGSVGTILNAGGSGGSYSGSNYGGTGGGGAGGPNGSGGAGAGNNSARSGGGGGGNGGGAVGGNPVAGTYPAGSGGVGGARYGGGGGGTGGTSGSLNGGAGSTGAGGGGGYGGGGSNPFGSGGAGSASTDLGSGVGSGGGGGGGGNASTAGAGAQGGLYGGGGGGGAGAGSTPGAGGNGRQGIMVISYAPDAASPTNVQTAATSNFSSFDGSEVATFSYSFLAGDAGLTRYLRACADYNATDGSGNPTGGTISETNEGAASNCGAWTAVSVTAASASCTFTVSPASIVLGNSLTNVTWACQNVSSCTQVANGDGFSTGGLVNSSDTTVTPQTSGLDQQYAMTCTPTAGGPAQTFYSTFFDVTTPNAVVTADPSRIDPGETTDISVSCTGMPGGTATVCGPSNLYPTSPSTACNAYSLGTVTGPTTINASGDYTYNFTTPPINAQAIFRAICEYAGETYEPIVTVKFNPIFVPF